MRRSGPPRLNRLPLRLDYTLIPAPLDLALPLVDEKAPLPAIIVTPSSPIGEKDFSIAFLLPTPKTTFRQRVSKLIPSLPEVSTVFKRRLPSQIQLPSTPLKVDFNTASSWSLKSRACTTILLAILLFIMGCHLLMHGLVAYHPRLNHGSFGDEATLSSVTSGNIDTLGGVQRNSADSATPTVGGWFNLHVLWAPVPITDGKRSAHFIIADEDYEQLQTLSN